MLKCEKRYWSVPFRGSFIGEYAGTTTPLWIRLRNAYNLRFVQFFEHFEFSISNFTYSFCIYIESTMTLINLDFIQFYRSFIKIDLTDKQLSMASINDVFVVYEKKYVFTIFRFSNEWNKQIDNNDLIEIFDLINSSLKNSFDLFYKQASNFKSTELCVENNIYCFWLCWAVNNSFRKKSRKFFIR